MNAEPVDVRAIRRHFTFPELGRIVTNNAASTQPPRELLQLYQSLAPGYENVHRGQSTASQQMTSRFEGAYDTIAQFIGAPGRASIALYRNTTEAINAVMYSMLTEFRDGDNVVTTLMEHNSNYAIIDAAGGRTIRYEELADGVLRVAAGLTALGLRRGDAFAILAPNSPEWLLACYGAIAAGGVVTGINPLYTPGEVAAQLTDANARFILTAPACVPTARAAVERAGGQARMIVLGSAIDDMIPFTALLAVRPVVTTVARLRGRTAGRRASAGLRAADRLPGRARLRDDRGHRLHRAVAGWHAGRPRVVGSAAARGSGPHHRPGYRRRP